MSDIRPTCLEHESIKINTSMIPDLSKKVDEMHVALMGTMEKQGWLSRMAIVERVVHWMLGSLISGVALIIIGVVGYLVHKVVA